MVRAIYKDGAVRCDRGRGGRTPYRMTKEQKEERSAKMRAIHAKKKAIREAKEMRQ